MNHDTLFPESEIRDALRPHRPDPDEFGDLTERQRDILEAPNQRYSYRKEPGAL